MLHVFQIVVIALIVGLSGLPAGASTSDFCHSLLTKPASQAPLTEIWKSQHLPESPPQRATLNFSKTYAHPVLEQVRQHKLVEDFKPLSDLILDKEAAKQRFKTADPDYLLTKLFSPPQHELTDFVSPLTAAQKLEPVYPQRPQVISYIENLWSKLGKLTTTNSKGSLIPLPYPTFIPGDRFQESYYWDSYFAIEHFLSTGREELVKMQIENFLYLISHYGFVPNGNRTYYLTRSQSPLIAQMIIELIRHEKKKNNGALSNKTKSWLRDKVLPLLQHDYHSFWMNPKTRLDSKTGLNIHWDDLNSERPERHSADVEADLGNTLRDTRAGAESGKDFTDTMEKDYTRVAPALLNSFMFRYEKGLAELHREIGQTEKEKIYLQLATRRQQAITKYLWDESVGVFRDYHLDRQEQLSYVTADIFVPLWAELATQEQAKKVVENLPQLEVAGGIMSSNIESGAQWDAPFGWAPHHYFAVAGMSSFKHFTEAHRIASKYLESQNKIFQRNGYLIEKFDAVRGAAPEEDGDKYETQKGFLWTNGVYMWMGQILENKEEPFSSSL